MLPHDGHLILICSDEYLLSRHGHWIEQAIATSVQHDPCDDVSESFASHAGGLVSVVSVVHAPFEVLIDLAIHYIIIPLIL